MDLHTEKELGRGSTPGCTPTRAPRPGSEQHECVTQPPWPPGKAEEGESSVQAPGKWLGLEVRDPQSQQQGHEELNFSLSCGETQSSKFTNRNGTKRALWDLRLTQNATQQRMPGPLQAKGKEIQQSKETMLLHVLIKLTHWPWQLQSRQ